MCCLQSCTKILNFKGQKRKANKWKSDLLSPSLLKNIGKKCPYLQELYISEAVVDAKKFKLKNLGEVSGLKLLSVIDCEFINLPMRESEGSYFRNMQIILPHLENLEISKCNWINDYDLMVLSKLNSLKKLTLKSDLRIGFTMVYLSLSFRFGFTNLEELDLRGTSLQNNDVQSIVQSGKLKALSIGPIECVKRLSNECDKGFNLVMSDPQQKNQPKQQVVVINMGPNGPNWHAANDDELDEMGLHWLRNGINQKNKTSENEHYFFGKEGQLIGKLDNSEGECSKDLEPNSIDNLHEDEYSKAPCNNFKRKLADCENFNDTDKHITKQLKTKHQGETMNSSNQNENNVLNYEYQQITVEKNLPDECLSDKMIDAFEDHCSKLEFLQLSGCSISNAGLIKLVKCANSLKYLDVSNTLVTYKGIQEARVLLPQCHIKCSTDLASSR